MPLDLATELRFPGGVSLIAAQKDCDNYSLDGQWLANVHDAVVSLPNGHDAEFGQTTSKDAAYYDTSSRLEARAAE